MSDTFHVALTADLFGADGQPKYRDIGLSVFDGHDRIRTRIFSRHEAEVLPEQIGDAQAVIVLSSRVTARSVSQADPLLAIARFGVGYDSVDIAACTAADVAVLIAAGAVDRSVAEATVSWMLALTHQVRIKDRLVRDGDWEVRGRFMGSELRDRTLGVIGFGGIGRALVRLLAGWGMKPPLVFDPFIDDATAQQCGVRRVNLDELMSSADFVSVHCPLNEQTRNLIGRRELSLMRRDAYLLNTARGGIVDEDALFEMLTERRIAGAAIDCFVGEPITAPHRFGQFDNVLLAPHCIAWTHELFADIGRTVCCSLIELASHRRPRGVVNPEVFEHPGFVEKWHRP